MIQISESAQKNLSDLREARQPERRAPDDGGHAGGIGHQPSNLGPDRNRQVSIVAFVRNVSTQEVLQAAQLDLGDPIEEGGAW